MNRVRNFSDWAYWRLHLANVELADPCPSDPAELEAWRARVRERLTEFLGPDPEPVPLDPDFSDSVDCGDYQRERVVFDTEATMSVPAYLLLPHGEARGAILAVHGHGPGKQQICEPAADGYADALARAGFVVLAPDLRGFGERADRTPDDKYHCDWNLVCATMAGVVPLARNVWDLRGALDLLETVSEAAGDGMGVVGFSYGATCTLFTAARDDRVRAACVSGYLSSWATAHTVPGNMCGSQVMPGMLGHIEHADVASLLGPRALFVESGVDDPIFPIDAARATVTQLGRIGVDVTHREHAGGHEWSGAGVPEFFAAKL
jgi:dienelactone hydrolase